MRRVLGAAGVVVAALMVFTVIFASGGTAQAAPAPAAVARRLTPGTCGHPGTISGALLPPVLGGVPVAANPCLPLLDLADMVSGAIPTTERPRVKVFIQGLKKLVGRIEIVATAVQCAYQADLLTIGFYQDPRARWSVAAVVIVQGRFDAIRDASLCLLMHRPQSIQPRLTVPGTVGSSPPSTTSLAPAFCFDQRTKEHNGHGYTILWVGSSNRMCAGLATSVGSDLPPLPATSTGPLRATVRGDPSVVRTGTSVAATPKDTALLGAPAVVHCYTDGQTVHGWAPANNHWDWVDTVNPAGRPVTGYIADVNVDTGGDITTQVEPCAPPATPSAPPGTPTPLMGTVRGDPVNVRPAPTTNATPIGRAAYGTRGTVLCYGDGEKISGGWAPTTNNHWDKVTIRDTGGNLITGYIADANLDTGGDITTQTGRCRPAGARPGDLIGTVRADPVAKIRSGPNRSDPIVGRAYYGSQGVVLCYRDGDMVDDGWGPATDHWDRVTIVDTRGQTITGYITHANLDTRGDIEDQARPC